MAELSLNDSAPWHHALAEAGRVVDVVRSESRKYKKNDEKNDEKISRGKCKGQTKKNCDDKTAAKEKNKKKMIKGAKPVWMRPSIASWVLVCMVGCVWVWGLWWWFCCVGSLRRLGSTKQ